MFSRLKAITGSQGLRQSAFFSLGNFIAYGISAVALLLISRKVGPVLFGEFWLSVGFLTILSKLQTFGLPIALQKLIGPVHQKTSQVQRLFQHSLGLLSLSILLGAVAGFVVTGILNNFLLLHYPQLLYFSILGASVTAVFEQVITYHQAIHRFDRAVTMMVLQAVLKLGVAGIFLSLPTITLPTLFLWFYLTPIVSVIFGLLTARFSELKKSFSISAIFTLDAVVVRRFWRIATHAVVMAVGLGMMEYVDIFLLQRYTTATETGLYSGVSQFALAITLIGQSVAGVLNARVSRYHAWPDLSAYLRKVPVLLVATIASFLIFVPFAGQLVFFTLGENYQSATPALIGLVLAALFFCATIPLGAVMYLQESADYFSISTLLLLVIQIGGGALFIPTGGLLAAVVVRVVSRAVVFIYALVSVLVFLRRKYSIVLSKPS